MAKKDCTTLPGVEQVGSPPGKGGKGSTIVQNSLCFCWFPFNFAHFGCDGWMGGKGANGMGDTAPRGRQRVGEEFGRGLSGFPSGLQRTRARECVCNLGKDPPKRGAAANPPTLPLRHRSRPYSLARTAIVLRLAAGHRACRGQLHATLAPGARSGGR